MTEATHSRVASGQAELAVTSWGDGGVPLLALHPGVGDSRIWRWCAPEWAAVGYRTVAYDRRGFGSTVAPTEHHDDMADLLAVLDAAAAGPAVVVGNSMGGGLALELAIEHPGRVRALVLIGASPAGYPYETEWAESQAEQEQDVQLVQADKAGDVQLVNRLETRYWLDGTEQPEGRVSGEARDLFLTMNGAALAAGDVGTATARPEVWSRLGEVQARTLVIAGGHDLPGMTGIAEGLVASIPDATLVTIDESAHCPSLDQPTELTNLVLSFLSA